MLDQLRQEYVLTARVKGLSETSVIWRHAFGNVLVQLITIIGLDLCLAARRLGLDRDGIPPGQASANTSQRPCSSPT